jgi:hypothetical protein
MSPEDRAADRLNDHLDAVVAGDATRSHDLDPSFAGAVERFFAADDAPGPPSGLADHLWEDLMHAQTIPVVGASCSQLVANGRVSHFWSGIRVVRQLPRSRWFLSQLATAALVVLTLVGSLVVLGPLRSRNSSWLPVLPVISGTPTAGGGIVTETLIDAPDATLPAGPVQLYVVVTELQPGVSVSLDGQVGTPSYYVEQGTVRISHAGVERIVHAGEQWSAPVDGVAAFENVGDEVARIVEADVNDAIATSSLGANYASKFSDPQGGTESFVINAAADLSSGAEGPTQVTLDRLILPPGAALASYAKLKFDWIGIAAGRLGVTLEGERLPFRWDPGEERTYGLFESLPPIQPGTEMTLRNAGDEQLVLYRLTIEPSGAGGSASLPPTP